MYILRHWRGDLSLGASCWFSGFIVGVVIPAAAMAATALLVSYSRPLGLALFLGARGLLIASQVWLAVGIWRAASRHVGRGGNSRWAQLARVAAATGALCAFAEFATAGTHQLSKVYDLLTS
jgi:hypothetical protein